MRGSLRPLLAIALVLPLAGCLTPSLVGQPAPAFELVTSDGARVNASTYAGRYVVLDLMATWCGPCRLEVRHLQEVQRVVGDRAVILSIGADPSETEAQLDAFARERGVTWPHGLDRDGSIGRAYGLRIIPKLVVIDPEGKVVLEREGEVLPAAIIRAIDPSAAPPEGRSVATSFAASVLAGTVGFLAALNPYRRLHRDAQPARAGWLTAGALALLALLAWWQAGLVSTRATYGSLAVGVATLGAVAWWRRARSRAPRPQRPGLAWEVGDRLYEASPHFALALVLSLTATDLVGMAGPLVALVGAYALAVRLRPDVPPAAGVQAGLAGLAIAGVGLVVFGARILVA